MPENSSVKRKWRNPSRGVHEARIRAQVAANRLALLDQQRPAKRRSDPEDANPADPKHENAPSPSIGPDNALLAQKKPRPGLIDSGEDGTGDEDIPRRMPPVQQPHVHAAQSNLAPALRSTRTPPGPTVRGPASIQRRIADNVATRVGGFYALDETFLQRSASDTALVTSGRHNSFSLRPSQDVAEGRGSFGPSLPRPATKSAEGIHAEREVIPGPSSGRGQVVFGGRGSFDPSTLAIPVVQSAEDMQMERESVIRPKARRARIPSNDDCEFADAAECLFERFQPIRDIWLRRFQAVASVRDQFAHRFCFLGLAMQFRDRTLTWRLLANKMRPLYARLIGRSFNRFPNVASILCKKHFPSGSKESAVTFPMAKAILIRDKECAQGIVESRLFDIEQHDEIITQSHRCGNGDCQDLHSVLQTLYENRTGRDGRCLAKAVLDYLSGKGVAEHCSEPSHRDNPCLLRRMVERRFAPSGPVIKESACFWRKKIKDLSPEEIGTRFRVMMNDLVLPTSELTSYDYSYMVWQEDNPEPHLPEIRYLSLPPLTEKLVSIHALVSISFMGENWDEYIASLS